MITSSSAMEILVSEQGQLKQYSNKDVDGVSNVSMLASTKRNFPEMTRSRTKKSKSGDYKKEDDCSLMTRTRPSSNKGHVNGDVEKQNSKKGCIPSNIEEDLEDEFLMDELEEMEMMFLFNLKGRRSSSRSRSSDGNVTDLSSKDGAVGNYESTNTTSCPSSPPASPGSSANNNTESALRNKVTSQYMHFVMDLNFDSLT